MAVPVSAIIDAATEVYNFGQELFGRTEEDRQRDYDASLLPQAQTVFNNPDSPLYSLSMPTMEETIEALRAHGTNWDVSIEKTGKSALPYHAAEATKKGEIYIWRKNYFVPRKDFEAAYKQVAEKKGGKVDVQSLTILTERERQEIEEKEKLETSKNNQMYYVVGGFVVVLLIALIVFLVMRKK